MTALGASTTTDAPARLAGLRADRIAAAPRRCSLRAAARPLTGAPTRLSVHVLHARTPSAAAVVRAAATDGNTGVATGLLPDIHPHIERLLFSEEEIQDAIRKLGKQLALEYQDKEPLLLTTLAGAFMFAADLCRAMTPVPDGLQLDFPRASSYGQNTVSSGSVELQFHLQIPIEGRHVLLLEDLVDSGRTLAALLEKLEAAKPASIKVVTLLRKVRKRDVDIEPDYCCLEFEGGFIVGYGIDYAENYRSLPYIGILHPAVYSS